MKIFQIFFFAVLTFLSSNKLFSQNLSKEIIKKMKFRHVGPVGNRVTTVAGIPNDPLLLNLENYGFDQQQLMENRNLTVRHSMFGSIQTKYTPLIKSISTTVTNTMILSIRKQVKQYKYQEM